MKGFLSSVVGGVIGLAALYAAAHLGYRAGREITELEHKYRELSEKAEALKQTSPGEGGEDAGSADGKEEAPSPAPSKAGKPGLFLGIKRLMGRKGSALGNIIRHPEAHRIEAYMQGEELRVSVKPRTA